MNAIQTVSGTNNMAMMFSDPAAIAAAESAKARIQSAYIVALQKPRNYDTARLRILKACSRPEFAEKVEYSKPAGGESVSGPSIRFAELALREWGNISYENQVVFDDENVRRIRVTVTDLESNATFSKEVQLSKTIERRSSKGREVISERLNSYGDKVFLVKATEDEVLTREAALISKALRNEGLRLIPQEIIEEGILVARRTMQSRDKQDPDAARKRLTEAFFAYGVKPTELEKYLGHPLEQCQPDELQELRTIYSAIRDNEAKWSSFMEKKEAERTEDEQAKAVSGTDALDQVMNATASSGASRIARAQRAVQTKGQATPQAESQPVQNDGLEVAQDGEFPFPESVKEAARKAENGTNGTVSQLEKLREEVTKLMGPEGLDLRDDERESFFRIRTQKTELKDIPADGLKIIIKDARTELAKRDGN
ncbi:MAG: hypothetical protein IJ702_09185 [Fretibacterium sp.]|nr:hypothetical protein [Fretibacterium sp.]